MVYVDDFPAAASTSACFFKLFLARALLSRRPIEDNEIFSWRCPERCGRKMVPNFSRTYVLFLFSIKVFLKIKTTLLSKKQAVSLKIFQPP
jgi:hypothetical protein